MKETQRSQEPTQSAWSHRTAAWPCGLRLPLAPCPGTRRARPFHRRLPCLARCHCHSHRGHTVGEGTPCHCLSGPDHALLSFLGWRRRGLPETDWSKEGQAFSLPSAADRRVRGQPHQPGVGAQAGPGGQREEEAEEEEEGEPQPKACAPSRASSLLHRRGFESLGHRQASRQWARRERAGQAC